MFVADKSLQLSAAVNDALVEQRKSGAATLRLRGAASRIQSSLTCLSCADHAGVVDYMPAELVLRVRAGTRLSDIRELLAQQGQRLAADFPYASGESTVGGAIAMGIDGPARSMGASIRDTVLGVQLINGVGERVSFGGQVMKNVAGFDVSRLQVGAMGCLGLLLECSLRLSPLAASVCCVKLPMSAPDAALLWRHATKIAPFYRAGFYHQQHLHLRFEGQAKALDSALIKHFSDHVSGHVLADFKTGSGDDWSNYWDLAIFNEPSLAYLVLPEPVSDWEFGQNLLVDWEGRRVWVANANHNALAQQAQVLGGFLRVVRGAPVHTVPLSQRQWHRKIKTAFDPHEIFNMDLFHAHFLPKE